MDRYVKVILPLRRCEVALVSARIVEKEPLSPRYALLRNVGGAFGAYAVRVGGGSVVRQSPAPAYQGMAAGDLHHARPPQPI